MPSKKSDSPLPEGFIRFHGRRKGKAVSPLKLALYERFMPELAYKDAAFFTESGNNVLEIGFGGGEHLAAMAFARPNSRFLGAEPFINGVAGLVHHLCRNGDHPDNVKIYADDIRKIYPDFPDAVFDEVYLLFPDPWRKKRHAERRFINEDNIVAIHRLLKPGKDFIVATDDPTYIDWVDSKMPEFADIFLPSFRSETPPAGWITTRYEAKALRDGRQPVYYAFRKTDLFRN